MRPLKYLNTQIPFLFISKTLAPRCSSLSRCLNTTRAKKNVLFRQFLDFSVGGFYESRSSSVMEILGKLKNLDAYPKVNEDFYNRSLSGGLITIFSAVAILFLFLSEIRLYIYSSKETKLAVDTSRGERLRINFDVTFPHIACSVLAVDTMDVSGEQHYDIRHDIIKKRIADNGNVIDSRKEGVGGPKIERPLQKHGGRLEHNENYCGSCYGAEASDDQCCNSCEDVREAYKIKGWGFTNPDMIDQCKREGYVQRIKDEHGEGCNIHGFVDVNKVAGNFHFAPGKGLPQFSFLQDIFNFQTENYNISHKINKISFGKEFPGVINPLDGVEWINKGESGIYQYFIKVVPTIYTDITGRKISSNQFSVTEHFRESIGYPKPAPGVYFFYEFSPIKVDLTEQNTSLLHFLTNLCAIIGGIFTVAGIMDSFWYHGHKAIKKKMEIGKFG